MHNVHARDKTRQNGTELQQKKGEKDMKTKQVTTVERVRRGQKELA